MLRRTPRSAFLNAAAEKFAAWMVTKRWEYQVGPEEGPNERPRALTPDEQAELELKAKQRRGRVYNGQTSFPGGGGVAKKAASGPAAAFASSYAATSSFPRQKLQQQQSSPAAEAFDERKDIPNAPPSSSAAATSRVKPVPSEDDADCEMREAAEAVARMEAEAARRRGESSPEPTTTSAPNSSAATRDSKQQQPQQQEADSGEAEEPMTLSAFIANQFRGGFGTGFDALNVRSVESAIHEWARRTGVAVTSVEVSVVAVDHLRIEVRTGGLGSEDEVQALREFIRSYCPLTRFRQSQAVRVAKADGKDPLDVVDIVAVRT